MTDLFTARKTDLPAIAPGSKIEAQLKCKVYKKGNPGIPAGAVYIGRGSPYGNPFIIGKDGDRDEVIRKFTEHQLPKLDLTPLHGCSLICFCAPLPCHGNPILEKIMRDLKENVK